MKHLQIAKWIMIVTGFWTFKKEYFTKQQHLFYRAYGIIMQLYFSCFIGALCVGLKAVQDNIQLIDAIGLLIFCSVMLIKIIICQRKSVRSIMNRIVDFDDESDTLTGKFRDIYLKNSRYNVIYGLSLFLVSAMCGVTLVFCDVAIYSYDMKRVKSGDLNSSDVRRPLPYHIWRPIDEKKHYYRAFLLDVLTATIGCTYNTATQIVYLSILTFILGQIKILQVKFEQMGAVCSRLGSEQERFMYLRSLIVEHQNIISFVKDLDENMKYLLFVEFTINPLQITCNLYEVLVFKVDGMFLFRVVLLLCMLIQMFTLTWHSNEIQVLGMAISQSVYDGEWYDLSEKFKQRLLIVMMRAQRPLTLAVGPFFILTNSTAVTSVKAAYSYLALLNNKRGD
ncbi:unnamed protein product [Phyllotreta striolata]|uniref:Odorant receptor n=1 Tax=Phyllotreta striolata TaxID=444603 RepID=A0A9N9TEW2_PHYSR|nr:unnamed protein product [Phyllotreta striolata]